MWWQNTWTTIEPWVAALTIALSVLVGMFLALLTGPGVWLMLLVAALINWLWLPGHFYSWWTLGVCAVLGLVGELLEMVSAGIGSKKFGGTGAGATGAVIGGLLGALVGTFALPLPVVGTVFGSIAGAAGGALVAERGINKRPWDEANKSAAGAALGRLAATAVKLVVAGAVAVVLLFGLIL